MSSTFTLPLRLNTRQTTSNDGTISTANTGAAMISQQVAIVGGAVVPLITGMAADRVGLQLALLVPALCYVWIAFYGIFAARDVVQHDAPVSSQA